MPDRTKQRCVCGDEILLRGPAQGMCPTCEDTDKAYREAAEERYQDRLHEAEIERQYGGFDA